MRNEDGCFKIIGWRWQWACTVTSWMSLTPNRGWAPTVAMTSLLQESHIWYNPLLMFGICMCEGKEERNEKYWTSQETPGVTGKFGLGIRNEAGQRLIEFCQENALVITNTLFQQHKRRLYVDITRWSTPKSDWLYSLQPKMEKLYTVSKNKTRSWLWLRTPYCQIQTEIEESRENH